MPHQTTLCDLDTSNYPPASKEIAIKKNLQKFADNSPFSWWLSDGQDRLPPEVERDNVEYKWKLTGMSEERLVHLVTQMRWRVGELGYCWYILGVKDNGALDGINEQDLQSSLNVIKDLVHRAKLSVELVEIVPLGNSENFISQVKIELDEGPCLSRMNLQDREERVMFLGAAGSGKTTLLSVLSDWGSLDDGRGKMRTRLLHHRHELLTGTTSSITHQPLVFLCDNPAPLSLADPDVLLQLERRRQILGEARVMQLIDSAGKLRFDWTVYSVLTASANPPDLAFIVIDAETGLSPDSSIFDTYELLRLLDIPMALLINKIDQASTEIISDLLEKLSEGIGESRTLNLYDESSSNKEEEGHEDTSTMIPVLLVSTVTGQFLPTLTSFLHKWKRPVGQSKMHDSFIYAKESARAGLIIEQVVLVAEVGPVVYGQVAFGSISVGDEMILGPQCRVDASPALVRIKSIQRLKCPVGTALSGQYVSIALQTHEDDANFTLDKGMILLLPSSSPSKTQKIICSPSSSSILSLKPLRRIIGDLTQMSGSLKSRFKGVLFVMGRRFTATLDVQPHRRNSLLLKDSPKFICLITFERAAATVFLLPAAPIIFIGDGRKDKFVGRVRDYFA